MQKQSSPRWYKRSGRTRLTEMDGISSVLFDWDGTLLDSYPTGYQASMAVFEHYGIPLDHQRFLSTYSPNWYETYRRVGIPSEEWSNADEIWREHYHQNPPELFPFARRTLEALSSYGYSLGLVTSGNRDRVVKELDEKGLASFFAALVCFEDTQQKKPHPAPLLMALESMKQQASKAAYVGDRPEDILMGRRAGSYTVGVESAYVTLEVLEAASPDVIFPNAGHLPRRFGPRKT